jgi:hypothetical protein
MTRTLSHGEAWLLEMAVRYWLLICGLNRSDDDLHLWLLRGGHGLSKENLRDTLRHFLMPATFARRLMTRTPLRSIQQMSNSMQLFLGERATSGFDMG